MLTRVDYCGLWAINFAPHVAAGIGMPDYGGYVQRQIYFRDYLDLFTGGITYPRLGPGPAGEYGVTLASLGLAAAHFEPGYIITISGKDCLQVDYPYPYPHTAVGTPKIEYVLIGEAAPPGSTYFYNISHRRSHYLTAPRDAFGIPAGTRAAELQAMANKGFILIDLFPFAISYNRPLRIALNRVGLSRTNFESLIDDLELMLGGVPPLLHYCSELKYCFVNGVDNMNNIIAHSPYATHLRLNHLSVGAWAAWGGSAGTHLLPIGGSCLNIAPAGILSVTRINQYRAYGKSGAGHPHKVPIQFAFDL
jgi:hypothetical protein